MYVSLHVHLRNPHDRLFTTLCVSGEISAYVRRNACCVLCRGIWTAAARVRSALSSCGVWRAVAKLRWNPMALLTEANGLARALDAMVMGMNERRK